MNHDPLQHLNASDLALLNLLISHGFDLRKCISDEPDAHPARATYIALLRWLATPCIRAATQAVLALEAEKSAVADLLREERARIALDDAVTITHRCLETTARSQSPDDPDNPDHRDSLDRHARQLRLLARPLIRTASRASSAPSPSPSTHHTRPCPASGSPQTNTHAPCTTSSSSPICQSPNIQITKHLLKHDQTADSGSDSSAQPASAANPTPIESLLSPTHTRPFHVPSPHHSSFANLLNSAPFSTPPAHHPTAVARLLTSVGQVRGTT